VIPSRDRFHASAIRAEGLPSDLHLALQYFAGVASVEVDAGGGVLRCDGVALEEVCRPQAWQ
jgi:hypothetical protein